MSAIVRIELSLSVLADGVWGDDCTIGQARKQAIESAIAKVQRTLKEGGSTKVLGVRAIEVIMKES